LPRRFAPPMTRIGQKWGLCKGLLIFQIDEEISVTATWLIERYAKSHGLQIPDALIAATSINRDLQLYTGNWRWW